jgi:hypothetical protein
MTRPLVICRWHISCEVSLAETESACYTSAREQTTTQNLTTRDIFQQFDTRLSRVEDDLRTLRAEANQRFEHGGQRIDQLNGRFDQQQWRGVGLFIVTCGYSHRFDLAQALTEESAGRSTCHMACLIAHMAHLSALAVYSAHIIPPPDSGAAHHPPPPPSPTHPVPVAGSAGSLRRPCPVRR